MTLMDAQQYDDTRDRRRRNLIIIGVFVVLILAWLTYHLRNYPNATLRPSFFLLCSIGTLKAHMPCG